MPVRRPANPLPEGRSEADPADFVVSLDVEKHLDRRIARSAVAAGLIGALIAGAAAVGGSIVGARLQSKSSVQQAHDDFIRSQRQSAYSQLLSDATQTLTATNEFLYYGANVAAGPDLIDTVQDGPPYEAWDTAFDKMQTDVYNIQVIGSSGAYKFAHAMLQASQDAISDYLRAIGDDPKTRPDYAEATQKVGDSMRAAQAKFVVIAQRDVGNSVR